MSDAVKLSAALAGNDDLNGLDTEAIDLCRDPSKLRVGVVVYDVLKITDQIDDEKQIPTVRIRKFEPLGGVKDVPKSILEAIAEANAARTNKPALPLDVFNHETSEED